MGAKSELRASVNEMGALYMQGVKIKEIAQQFGADRKSVSRWLEEAGYKRKKGTPWPEETKDRAVELYLAGYRSKDIAKLMKTTPSNISNWLRGRGYDPKHDVRVKETPMARLLDRFENPEKKENPIENPKHACGTRWSQQEKQRVLTLIQQGVSRRRIYQTTGASVARQRMIAREFGLS